MGCNSSKAADAAAPRDLPPAPAADAPSEGARAARESGTAERAELGMSVSQRSEHFERLAAEQSRPSQPGRKDSDRSLRESSPRASMAMSRDPSSAVAPPDITLEALPDDGTCRVFKLDTQAESFGVCICGKHRTEHLTSAFKAEVKQTEKIAFHKIAGPAKVECEMFQVDVTAAAFGTCVCGKKRAEHSDQALNAAAGGGANNSNNNNNNNNGKKKPKKKGTLEEAYSIRKATVAGLETDAEGGPKACDAFVVNVEATSFGVCATCGLEQKVHSAEARQRRVGVQKDPYSEDRSLDPLQKKNPLQDEGGRVATLVAKHESLIEAAFAEASSAEAAADALLYVTDIGKASREIARRRQLSEQRAAAARRRGAVDCPKVTNVSGSSAELVLQVECPMEGATLEYYCGVSGVALSAGVNWARHPPNTGEELQITLTEPGRHVLIARATKPGMAPSEVINAVFRLEPPKFLFAAQVHGHDLSVHTDKVTSDEPCSVCDRRLQDFEHYYRCNEPACLDKFALCSACALPKDTEAGATVAFDAGARRLWLSDTIRFEGNSHTIVSLELLESLRGALVAHPAICVRLEGHTNSKCGLDCDGSTPCDNARCRSQFGKTGGAVAFSLARSNAVRDWLVEHGCAPDRLSTIGCAGSRRLVDDTESQHNDLNRRVEAHLDTD